MIESFRDVTPLLFPRSIAIVGASQREDSWPARIYRNLLNFGFSGPVYLVNPRYRELYGATCYPSVLSLPEPVDQLVVVVRAPLVATVLEEAGVVGCRSAIVFSGGFGELGTEEGRSAEAAVQAIAERYRIRICGPNCLGNLSLPGRVVTFAEQTIEDYQLGGFAFVSHSSGVMGAALRFAAQRGIGISYGIAAGNEANTDIADYLNFLAEDEHTRVVGMFLEGVRRPNAFAVACEKLAQANKPVALIKVGRSAGAKEAAVSHTGALVGSHEAFTAFAERYGLILVNSTDDIVEIAELTSRRIFQVPEGLAVVSLSGGVRGFIYDLCEQMGVPLAKLSSHTLSRLSGLLGVGSAVGNPLDIGWGGLSSQETYLECVRAIMEDPAVQAVAVQEELPRSDVAERRAQGFIQMDALGQRYGKPVIFYSRGSYAVTRYGLDFHRKLDAPFLQELHRSFLAISRMMSYVRRRQDLLRRRDTSPADERVMERWQDLLVKAYSSPLPETDAFRLLSDGGIPVPPWRVATSPRDAEAAAEELGLPVAIKLSCPGVTHKTELGGVRLGLRTPGEVRLAAHDLLRLGGELMATSGSGDCALLVQKMVPPGVELFLSCVRDPEFGPVISLGLGGIWVELLRDVQHALAPIDEEDAQRMIRSLRGGALLRGARGQPPADEGALVAALVNLSRMGLALGQALNTIEINPFIVGRAGEGGAAVDVLVVLPKACAHTPA